MYTNQAVEKKSHKCLIWGLAGHIFIAKSNSRHSNKAKLLKKRNAKTEQTTKKLCLLPRAN